MFFQPPFPSDTTEAEAIVNIGFMYADFLVLFCLMIFMIYSYRKMQPLISIVVYLFSLIFGFEALGHEHTHFSPFLEIFFLLFQTSIFIIIAIEINKGN